MAKGLFDLPYIQGDDELTRISLMEQLKNGQSAVAIRASWQPGLIAFKNIRKKYLLYKDFE